MPKNAFNTLEVLALSIAAYQLVGNKIERWDGEHPGNKELVIGCLNGILEFAGCRNETLMEQAQAIRNSLSSRIMINALTSARVNDFLIKVNEAISTDAIKSRDIGLVIWAPKLADDLAREDNNKITMSSFGVGSNHIGRVKEKITVKFTVLKQKYLQNYNIFLHTGHDENGNLINFFNKTKIESGTINGRVKAHQLDSYNNGARVTVLNYVKVL